MTPSGGWGFARRKPSDDEERLCFCLLLLLLPLLLLLLLLLMMMILLPLPLLLLLFACYYRCDGLHAIFLLMLLLGTLCSATIHRVSTECTGFEKQSENARCPPLLLDIQCLKL
jgi:uncharacterized metal-binding protein